MTSRTLTGTFIQKRAEFNHTISSPSNPSPNISQIEKLHNLTQIHFEELERNICSLESKTKNYKIDFSNEASQDIIFDELLKNTRKKCDQIMSDLKQIISLPQTKFTQNIQRTHQTNFQKKLERILAVERKFKELQSGGSARKELGDDFFTWDEPSSSKPSHQLQLLRQEEKIGLLEQQVGQREKGISQINTDLQAINQMFKDFHSMEKTQGDMLDTIEANLEMVVTHTQEARIELVSADSYHASASKKELYLKIFGGLSTLGAGIGMVWGVKRFIPHL